MSIVDMICRMNEIVTEIRKCESLYFHCDDSGLIYNHLLRSLNALQKPSILFEFAREDLDENSSIENLKLKLIELYGSWRKEFLKVMKEYHQAVETSVL